MGLGLVLGGGGVAGIAWELGVLQGLADEGTELIGADRVVGTSAGSVVGSQITSGLPLEELFADQLAERTPERAVDFDPESLGGLLAEAMNGSADRSAIRRKVGEVALAADTIPEAERREIIAARLPVHSWPDRELIITGVDALTGELVTWTRDSGVPLVDAVAASCAVPGVWPPATIDGRRYIDGGMASPTNALLAQGCSEILVLAPLRLPIPGVDLDDEVRQLSDRARVCVIEPDEASKAAFGDNPLDPATRVPAAKAGRSQGRVEAFRVGLNLSL